MEWMRYGLIAFACFLVSLITVLIYKYRKLIIKREASMGKEDVIGRLFLRKVRKIEALVGKEEPHELLKNLNRTMRSFFSELFDIRYQFDYVELNEELTKKGIEERIRRDVIAYTIKMSQAGYGREKISEEDFYPLIEKSIKVVSEITGGKHELVAGEIPATAEAEEKAEKESEETMEKTIKIPKDDKEKMAKLMTLLIQAEQDIKEKSYENAMENYSAMKEIYNSLSPDVKIKIYDETRRIIAIYNALLNEYKDILTSKR